MGKKVKKKWDYLGICLGALLASFSVACILLPNDAIDYGTAGIAIVVSKLTGFNLSLCVLGIVCPFVVVGRIFLGRKFCIKAVTGVIVYTVGLEVFKSISIGLNTEHFIAVAFGGAALGVGLALILKCGGCIDGSEILANVVMSLLSDRVKVSVTGILLVFNVCVYSAVFFCIDKNSALMSLLVYVVATSVIDHFIDHFESVKEVKIITKHCDEIVSGIRERLKKTCTIINSAGVIAGENKTVICYVSYFELQELRDLIDEIELDAFVTVNTIEEVL